MARPRKITNEQMMEIVDTYYHTRCDGNEKLLKCSLIAKFAQELGFDVKEYDFARNMEVREHIERWKVCAETTKEVYGRKYKPTSYKSLDVDAFLRNNNSPAKLADALRELDGSWLRIYESYEEVTRQNWVLMHEKAKREKLLCEKDESINRLNTDVSKLITENNKLSIENRYLRKMLRKYLYPALADEILRNENEPPPTNTIATDIAISDFIEDGVSESFESSVANDNRIQSESELFLAKLWEDCDEDF
jgi:hypothetical protein